MEAGMVAQHSRSTAAVFLHMCPLADKHAEMHFTTCSVHVCHITHFSLMATCTFTRTMATIAVQEVTDAEGRRRFHGAFTGGYSAGFYNTVGSLEGWEPKTFKSSREQRAGDRYADMHQRLGCLSCIPHACSGPHKLMLLCGVCTVTSLCNDCTCYHEILRYNNCEVATFGS